MELILVRDASNGYICEVQKDKLGGMRAVTHAS